MSPHPAIAALQEAFSAEASPTDAAAMEAYMKGVAPFYGIKTDRRRAIQKEVWALCGIPAPGDEAARFARTLFSLPQRELHYAALEALQASRKCWQPGEVILFDTLLHTKPWWDTVDVIATKLIAPYFQRFYGDLVSIVRYWAHHESFWIRRASIIFQIPYKARTDAALLFENIRINMRDKEFFIQKGIGWALREYAKVAPDAVRAFVESEPLAPLSKREATRRMG